MKKKFDHTIRSGFLFTHDFLLFWEDINLPQHLDDRVGIATHNQLVEKISNFPDSTRIYLKTN